MPDYVTTTNATQANIYSAYDGHIYNNVFVTTYDLDAFANRLYKIIEEHTKIDISQEDFISLLKGD